MSKTDKYYWWLFWLKKMGITLKLWKENVILDPDSWKVYYDEGLNITEALTEDLKQAQ